LLNISRGSFRIRVQHIQRDQETCVRIDAQLRSRSRETSSAPLTFRNLPR
jgi:hypothetical protein